MWFGAAGGFVAGCILVVFLYERSLLSQWRRFLDAALEGACLAYYYAYRSGATHRAAYAKALEAVVAQVPHPVERGR
jgi:hypothetical protein